MTHQWRDLIDIADMPGYNEAALTDARALENVRCVSDGRIRYGLCADGAAPSQRAVPTVVCREHGATLAVARHEHGVIWRCPTCNVGAFEPRS